MLRSFINKYWRDILILVPVVLIASMLRLNEIRGYQLFLGDQGRDALIVKRMIVDGDPTFIGPNASVGGFFLGPLYYYMMIPPMLLSRLDPIGPAIQVAVISILTNILLYYYMKRYVGIAGALVSSAIYSVSVLVVEYARFSWNPNVLPFFSILLIIAWTKILARDTKQYLFWFFGIGILLGSIIQLHYAAIIMLVVSVILYMWHLLFDWIEHRKLHTLNHFKEVICIIAGFTFILFPFIGFEIKNSFPNTNGIISFVFQDRDDGFSGGAPFEFIVRDVSHRLFLRLVAGGNTQIMPLIYLILILGITYGLYRLCTMLIVYVRNTETKSTARAYLRGFLADARYRTQLAVFLVLATWWIWGVGWWGFYKKSIYDYYFSYMYPLPIMVFGIACALIFHMYSRRLIKANIGIRVWKIALWVFIGIIAVINVQKLQTMFPGMQVQRSEWAAESIIKMLGDGPYNFALIADGNSDHAYRFFLEIRGYTPVSIDKMVTDQLIVLCEVDTRVRQCEPEGHPLWEVAGFGPAKIVGQSTAIGYPLYRLQHVEGEEWRIGLPAQKGD